MASALVEVDMLTDLLPQLASRFPGALDAVLSAAAERTAEYAKAHHPWENRTGQTEESIRFEQVGEHEFAAVAGGAMSFLEYGTVHMPPFPTMQPAYDAVRPSMQQGLAGMMTKVTTS